MAETTHGKHYASVKKYYDLGLWSLNMVRNAVIKNWITEDEFKEITGEDYETDTTVSDSDSE